MKCSECGQEKLSERQKVVIALSNLGSFVLGVIALIMIFNFDCRGQDVSYLINRGQYHPTQLMIDNVEIRWWMLDQYAKECYADSTVHEQLRPCYSLVDPPCPGHPYEPPRFYTTHREPTFVGFIEFMRKRIQEGK
jgi:hypothetical protein